ncbi:hypothetical protein [Shewanella dokdonensis]|uniref:Uncharacterized protein n=1 Tax=Shewanella dokdonensis TaxID=712036 RepID=A0ABX8DFX1_9GAMM|nr:hypothetical protein [Shewanella dokdonensis]MCL1076495.1 hypothetical protein [Shewanella dokdonensis]QVK23285.1 hypothetical protein KHX94_00100 [Shewanella dokdonensis]
MKTRNIQTVIDSDLVANVVPEAQGFGELQVRCLSKGDKFIRYIVVDSAEVEQKPFAVRILAEAQFNNQREKFSFSAPELSIAMASRVKDTILTHLPVLNQQHCHRLMA